MSTVKRIGVWIELHHYGLGAEGIGRLLRFVVEGSAVTGYHFVFACPSWYRQQITDFINEFDHKTRSRITVLLVRQEPSFFNKFKPTPTKKKQVFRLTDFLTPAGEAIIKPLKEWSSQQSLATLIMTAIILSPLLVPVALLVAAYIQALAVRQFLRGSQHPWFVRARKHIQGMKAFYKDRLRILLRELHNISVEQEYTTLASVATMRKDVLAWYVPNPSWWHASRINKPLVVAAPDYVLEEFPFSFIDIEQPAQIKRNIARMLAKACCTISYRNYVKEKHVVKLFKFPANRAFVVPHAPVDLSNYLNDLETTNTDDNNIASVSSDKVSCMRKRAADRVRAFFCKTFEPLAEAYPFQYSYLPSFPFEDARFIIVSTRLRGYKNILKVIEAINILVRKRQFNVKILLTGHFDDEIREYVRENCLQYDVIPLCHVPADIHAYLFYLASVCIHPSFFEGGFPFVFSEALSVGTPVVLANVPSVTEVIDPAIDGDFLFNPYSANDIADKIQYAFRNSDLLLERQQRLLGVMKQRNWSDVANEYITVFEKASLIWSSGDFKSAVEKPENCPVQEPTRVADTMRR